MDMMALALLVARLLLAGVFVVAGLAKLADLAGSRQAMRDFGVPARLAGPFGTLLPLAELAVAVALLPVATAWWGAVGALTLLLFFVAGIGISLARGRKPDCHCFGQLHSEPVGWRTLVRNGLMAAVAGFVVWQGWARSYTAGPSAFGWLDGLTVAERVGLIGGLVALGLLGVMVWLLVHLLGQNGRLLLRLEALEAKLAAGGTMPEPASTAAPAPPESGLPVGTPAPAFALTGLYGETLTLDALRAPGKPVLLIFSDPGCGPCNALLPDLGRWQGESAAKATMALISRGTPEANRAKSTEHGLTNVLLQRDREVAEAYEVNGTPSAVLIRPDGTIGSPLAAGADAIRLLVARTIGLPNSLPTPSPAPAPIAPASAGNGAAQIPQVPAIAPRPAGPKVGEPAPPIALPDLRVRHETTYPTAHAEPPFWRGQNWTRWIRYS